MITRNRITLRKLLASLAIAVLAVPLVAPQLALAAYQSSDVLGQPDFTSSGENTITLGEPNQYGLNTPMFTALDGMNHRLFISDTGNARVLVFDLDADNVPLDYRADAVLGQQDFESKIFTTSQSGMEGSDGLAYDVANDLLYVADDVSHRILVFDVATITNGEDAINVLGQEDFFADAAGFGQDEFQTPGDVALDPGNNRLFVADSQNNRIMVFDVAIIDNGEDAVNVLGQPDFTTTTLGLSQSKLWGSWGLDYDAENDHLFVADTFNNRVVVFDVDPAVLIPNNPGSDGPDAINVLGQEDFVSGDEVRYDWTVSFDEIDVSGAPGPNPQVYSFAIDSVNGTLYAGVGNEAHIYRCNLVTDCDENADWTLSLEDSGDFVYSMTFDPVNGVLYAGTDGVIRRCIATTGCNENTDWTVARASGGLTGILSLMFDATTDVLYAGSFPSGIIFRCDTATGCDTTGEWTTSFDTTSTGIASLVSDVSNGILYAGTETGGIIYRCDTATVGSCNDAADWTVSRDTAQTTIEGIGVDTVNGILYAGTGSGNVIYRCIASTGCDTAGEWTTSTSAHDAYVFTFDPVNAVLYAGGISEVHRCDTTTGCDFTAEWTTSFDNLDINLALTFDAASDTLYLGGDDIFRCETAEGCDAELLMQQPRDVAYDPNFDRLFVGDTGYSRALVFDVALITDGEAPINVLGQPDFQTEEVCCVVDASSLGFPRGLTYDVDNDRIYFAEQLTHRISVFDVLAITDNEDAVDVIGQVDSNGDPTFTAGSADNQDNPVLTVVSDQGLSGPVGSVVDTVNHRLFVGDSGNNRVLVYELDADNALSDHTADFVLGQSDFSSDAASVSQSGMSGGEVLAYDPDNNRLFVAEENANRVLVFDVSSITNGEDAVAVLGQLAFTSSLATTTQNGMSQPLSVAYDRANELLFVVDASNNRTLVFDVATVTNGELAVNVLGQENFISAGAATTQDGMSSPSTAAYDDGNERLFIGEQGSNRVTVFNLSGGISDGMDASNVLGQENFVSSAPVVSQDGMNAPYGLDYDAELDQLVVSDQNANRVLIFDVATVTDGEDALAVVGQDDFTSGGSGLDQERFNLPYQPTLDEDNRRLYVPDFNNNRVLIFDLLRITTETMSTGVVGADYNESIDYEDSQGTVTFSLVSGSLPPGLLLDGSSGQVSGTPTTPGTSVFTVRAEDDNGGAGVFVDQQEMSITVFSSGGYLASDLLGQLDQFGDPVYQSAGSNDSPSARGFYFGGGDVAVDIADHRIFVADTNNHRILVFDLDAGNQLVDRTADHVIAQMDMKGIGAITNRNTLAVSGALAYDPVHKRLFAGDHFGGRILVFDADPGTLADGDDAINLIGYTEYDSSDTPTNRNGFATFEFGAPSFAYDPNYDRLFVADWGRNRVMVFDVDPSVLIPNDDSTNGPDAINVIGQTSYAGASAATTQSTLDGPAGLAYDAVNDHVFVVDTGNDRVMVFDADPSVLVPNDSGSDGPAAINVLGHSTYDNSDTPGDRAKLDGPVAVAHDPADQRLFVADYSNRRIMVFGVASITDGEDAINVIGQPDYSSTSSAVTQDQILQPYGLAYDTTAKYVYVVSSAANRVMAFDADPAVLVADDPGSDGPDAVDLLGQLDENDAPVYTTSGLNNSPNPQGFFGPYDVAVDVVGHRLFVSDAINNRILVFNLDADNVLVDRTADFVLGQEDFKQNGAGVGQDQLSDPQGLVYDTTGQRLFVAENSSNRVTVFNVASITNGEDAVNVLGQEDFTSSGDALTQDDLSAPQRLAYDPATNRLFVADLLNNRVMVFDVVSITDGEDAINVLGQDGFGSSVGNTTQDGLNGPRGLTYDTADDRLFVVDVGNSRVMVFDVVSITDGEDAINVLGQDDFVSGNSATNQDSFTSPDSITYDTANARLFVADANNNRVMVFDAASITDGEDAVAVLGQINFNSSGAGTTQYSLNVPFGMSFDDEVNRLYAVDNNNNRVMVFDFVRITTLSLPDGEPGQAYSADTDTVQSQGAVSFAVSSGTLPPGLSLNSSTGEISGTPTTDGDYAFTVRASDDNGPWGVHFDDQEYTMTVLEGEEDGGGGGGFIPGTTPTPIPTVSPTPAPGEPLAGYIVVDDGAVVTKDRFVKLSFKHPFADDSGVTMRTVNGGQLASNDRDVVAGNTARQQETSANPTPTVAPNTPEMSSGEVRPFTPEVFGWDLCAGTTDCRPSSYNVFVQYYKAGSAPSSLTVLAGMAGDQTSYIYTDDVAYVPPAAMPFPPPGPVAPGPGPSGPSGPVATPAPIPSPTPSASATPATSPIGLPSAGPSAPSSPFSLQSLGLSPAAISAIGEAITVAAPIIVILAVAPLAIALATALAAGNAVAFTMFTVQSLLTIFGLKRRPRVWGTVYDAKTKHPIAYAKVELRDQANRVLETRYTDSDGRYGFLITPASLQQESLRIAIAPSAKNYAFPSALVTGDPDYIVYDHVYRGGEIAIRRDELVNYNIPMDPGMTPAKVGRPWSYASTIVDGILNAAFWIGLVVLPLNAFFHPSLFTIGMLLLFIVANAVRLGTGFHRPYGIVRDERSGTAMPYSLVTLNDPTGRRIAFSVSDDRGRYILLAKPGSYLVTAHTPAQAQPQRERTTAVTTKKGWVTTTVNT